MRRTCQMNNFCLCSFISCFILILCSHMLFSQILRRKLRERNVSFYISSRHVTVKQSVTISRNLSNNLSMFLLKISNCKNNYDSKHEMFSLDKFSCMAKFSPVYCFSPFIFQEDEGSLSRSSHPNESLKTGFSQKIGRILEK